MASGFEIVGLIGSIINIIEITIKAYGGIKDLHNLPEAFHRVNDRLPLIKIILTDAKAQPVRDSFGNEAAAAKSLLEGCETKTKKLQDIFMGIQTKPSSGESAVSVYRSLVLKVGKASRVENLMSDILKDLLVLVAHSAFRTSMQNRVEEIKAARQELTKVPPSLTDSDLDETCFCGKQTAGRDINNFSGSATQENTAGNTYKVEGGNLIIGGNNETPNKRWFDVPFHTSLGPISDYSSRFLTDTQWADPDVHKRSIENAKGGLLRKSYEWILNHPDFRALHDNEKSQLLWIRGGPGKGKTMLLCGIVDELKKSISEKVYLSFFFCQGTNSQLNNATAVLTSLMHRLAKEHPSLTEDALAKHGHANWQLLGNPDAFYKLSEIILDALQRLRQTNIFLVIDALDECETDLLKLLRFIVEVSRNISCVKWIVSSRGEKTIKDALGGNDAFVTLSLEQNERAVSAAINTYIDDNLRGLRSLRRRDEVRRLMQEKAKGTFLWVSFACKELKELQYLSGVQYVGKKLDPLKLLDEIPSDLEEVYHRMMGKIWNLPGEDREICRSILSTMTLTYRPLHILELGALSGVSSRVDGDAGLIKEFAHMCGPFLLVEKDDSVHFLHQSAKDYLLNGGSTAIFPFGHAEVHYSIFSRSLDAMSMTLKRNIYDLEDPGSSVSDRCKTPKTADSLINVKYSCLYWIDHLCEANHTRNTLFDFLPRCLMGIALIDNISAKLFALAWLVRPLRALFTTYLGWIGINGLQCQRDLGDSNKVHEFLQNFFLKWLEALGLLESMPKGIAMLIRLQSQITPDKQPELYAFVSDARQFTCTFQSVIQEAPLQVYSSALIFSPTRSVIRNHFLKEVPTWTKKEKLPTVEANRILPRTLEGHTSEVNAVAFAPNGNLMASASGSDPTVRFWNPTTGNMLQKLDSAMDCSKLLFSPDSTQLAAVLRTTVWLWGITEGTLLQKLGTHDSEISDLAFSPDGKQLAYCWGSWIWLGDPVTGKMRYKLDGHTKYVTALAFSPDGTQLAVTGLNDKTVRFWNPTTGAQLRVLECNDTVSYPASLPIDNRLAIDSLRPSLNGGEPPFLHPWDLVYWKTFSDIRRPEARFSFSSNGEYLASSSWDGNTCVWDLITGKLLHKLHTSPVSCVEFSRDGSQLAYSLENTVWLWDTTTRAIRQILKSHTGIVFTLTFSPDGSQLASSSRDGTIQLWDTTTEAPPPTKEGRVDFVEQVTISPNGVYIVSLLSCGIIQIQTLVTGTFFTGILPLTLRNGKHKPIVIAVSPDDHQLATMSGDGTIGLWDMVTGAQLSAFGCLDKANAFDARKWLCSNRGNLLTFSPNGRRLATGVWQVRLWDPVSETRLLMWEAHTAQVNIVIFSPHGNLLASASSDGIVRLWDAERGTELFVLKSHASIWERLRWDVKFNIGAVMALAFSPDGKQLAFGPRYGDIWLWDLTKRTPVHTLRPHERMEEESPIHPSKEREIEQKIARDIHDTTMLWDLEANLALYELLQHRWDRFCRPISYYREEKYGLSYLMRESSHQWITYNTRRVLVPAGHQVRAWAVRDNKLLILDIVGRINILEVHPSTDSPGVIY